MSLTKSARAVLSAFQPPAYTTGRADVKIEERGRYGLLV